MGFFSRKKKSKFDSLGSEIEIETDEEDLAEATEAWEIAQKSNDAIAWYEAIDDLLLADLNETATHALHLASARFDDLRPWCQAKLGELAAELDSETGDESARAKRQWGLAQKTDDPIKWYEAIEELVLAELDKTATNALKLASTRFADLKPWCEAQLGHLAAERADEIDGEQSAALHLTALDHLTTALRFGRSPAAERDAVFDLLEVLVGEHEIPKATLDSLRNHYPDNRKIHKLLKRA